MDETTYQHWWPLHIRVATGETLSAKEQTVYETGKQQLEAEEPIHGSIEELRRLRQEAQELMATYEEQQRRYEVLKAEIAAQEGRLSPSTKQLLGVGS